MKSLKVAVFLALKSISRGNSRVLILTIAMLILVYLNLVFTPAILAGAVDSVNNKTINTISGDIIVQAAGEAPVIGNASELVPQIESLDGVQGACARNSLGADVSYQGLRTTTSVYAIDPEQDQKVFQISQDIIEGSYLSPDDTDQILLGVQIAGNDRKNLELYSSSLQTVHAGDQVTVKYAGGVKRQYTVKGIFYTELVEGDQRSYITEKEFDTMNPLMKGSASAVYVKTKDNVKLETVIEEIRGLRPGLKFQTWEDVAGFLRSMTDSFKQIIVILQVIAFIVAAITIFIVTYVDLVNKRRQIGIERAIGITGASIILSYIFRAIIYAIVGILAAALIFVYIVVPVEARTPFHFPFGDVLLPVNVTYLITSGLILCAVATVSAFIPAWQTIRIKIIDAIWSS
jgi:putative ABC transport system permease protein